MSTIWPAIVGWAMVAVGSSIVAQELRYPTEGGLLALAGVLLVVARAAAVRFDRLHPPK